MVRFVAALVSVAVALAAELPVYALNADALVPANTVLTPELGTALIGHWTGENLVQDMETAATAESLFREVASPLLSTENAVVVVVHGLRDASAMLGSPFIHIDSNTPLPAPVPAGPKKHATVQFEQELAKIDNSKYAVGAVDATGVDPVEAQRLIAALHSRALVIGAPARSLKDELRVLGEKVVNPFRRQTAPTSRAPGNRNYGPFQSQEECEAATDDCSGRGECVKQRSSWACACKATKDKSEKYTYYWGGYNCAKRDVSAQFNLLLWSTLLLTGIITGGVILMFNMGSEPLPGILTAS